MTRRHAAPLVAGLAATAALTLAASAPTSRPTTAPAVATTRPAAGIEAALLDHWEGCQACLGDVTFRPDGTYERRHHSPDNNTLAGTWALRLDAIPPTLTLVCKASDDAGFVGRTEEFRVTRLDADGLELRNASGGRSHFARGSREAVEARTLARLQGTWSLVSLARPDGTRADAAELTAVPPLVVKGDAWSTAAEGDPARSPLLRDRRGGTITVDLFASEPNSIDLAYLPDARQPLTALFARDGDTLTMSVGTGAPPDALGTAGGRTVHVFRLRKE